MLKSIPRTLKTQVCRWIPNPGAYTIVNIGSASNGKSGQNITISADGDSAVRFNYPLNTLTPNATYTCSFTVLSLTDPSNEGVEADWCDGNDSMPDTLPPGTVMLHLGLNTFQCRRTSYDSTYRFLDIGNNGDINADSISLTITPPVLVPA